MKVPYYVFEGITFTPLQSGDLDELAAMLKKETVCRYLFFGPNTARQTRAFFRPLARGHEAAIRAGELPSEPVFIMRRQGRFLGNCALRGVAFSPGNYELSCALDDTAWRQGYGTLACRFLVNYGFRILNARRLSADFMAGNEGSRGILLKNGFRPEGVRQQYWLLNGQCYDNVLVGLTRKRWEAQASDSYVIAPARKEEFDELTRLWEASVRASHHFLDEKDIVGLRPLIRHEYLPGIGTLLCARRNFAAPAAFAGIEDGKLEMLFVDPALRGQGLGKLLTRHAIETWRVRQVDVNEQNPEALGFYLRMGFVPAGRDETDPQGRPFPILHLELPRQDR